MPHVLQNDERNQIFGNKTDKKRAAIYWFGSGVWAQNISYCFHYRLIRRLFVKDIMWTDRVSNGESEHVILMKVYVHGLIYWISVSLFFFLSLSRVSSKDGCLRTSKWHRKRRINNITIASGGHIARRKWWLLPRNGFYFCCLLIRECRTINEEKTTYLLTR